MSLNVVILAAGMGKRMRSDLPKVLHPLAGRPMLAHVLATARALAPQGICVVYGHGGEQVPRVMEGSGIAFARQEPQLGTGHAVQQALPHLADGETTLVLYGDVPLIRAETLRALADGNGLRLLTAKLEDPSGYGRIVRDRARRITRIVEEKDATPAQRRLREINTGIMVIPTRHLAGWLARLKQDNAQKEYYLTDLVALALEDEVAVTALDVADRAEILGVNTAAQLAQVERLYQKRAADRLLEEGVRLADPARFDVRGEIHCGRDVVIDVNCIFEGEVRLADGVEIGPNCVLRNVTAGPGTRIAAYTHIEDAKLGNKCRIGPYARIRPGTHLADDVHIGNFVEVKASVVGAGSKANHLTYIGDATVGRDVNIGAGTITCNYDGADKHRTVIEDDVHIGSDVQLVAPVTVAKGATIGAGTTVWKDTPSGGLVINAKTQKHLPGWQRPRKKRSQ